MLSRNMEVVAVAIDVGEGKPPLLRNCLAFSSSSHTRKDQFELACFPNPMFLITLLRELALTPRSLM